MNYEEWKHKTAALRQKDKLRRSNAIHLYCLDCVGYELYAITKCACYHCPLWEWRTGAYTPIGKNSNLENERTGE